MGSTPKYGLRYPDQVQSNDVSAHMATLAADTEAGLQQSSRLVSTVFTASGTWTKPTGALWVEVQMWGGGGPGSPGHSSGASGGSGAERATVRIPAAVLPATVSVIVGAGGTFPVNGETGTNGGTSSFGDYVRARGGAAPILRETGGNSRAYYTTPGAGVYADFQPDSAGGGFPNYLGGGGGSSMFGGAQGGGGAPATTGSAGGGTGVSASGGGAGGTPGSPNGQPGANKSGPNGGAGGGQGAQSGDVANTAGGNGGAGGVPGGGGGGGGFGGSNGIPGAGNGLSGPGGRGEVRVYVICVGK